MEESKLKLAWIFILKACKYLWFKFKIYWHVGVIIIDRFVSVFRGRKILICSILILYYTYCFYKLSMLSFEFSFLIFVLVIILLLLKEYVDRILLNTTIRHNSRT